MCCGIKKYVVASIMQNFTVFLKNVYKRNVLVKTTIILILFIMVKLYVSLL